MTVQCPGPGTVVEVAHVPALTGLTCNGANSDLQNVTVNVIIVSLSSLDTSGYSNSADAIGARLQTWALSQCD